VIAPGLAKLFSSLQHARIAQVRYTDIERIDGFETRSLT